MAARRFSSSLMRTDHLRSIFEVKLRLRRLAAEDRPLHSASPSGDTSLLSSTSATTTTFGDTERLDSAGNSLSNEAPVSFARHVSNSFRLPFLMLSFRSPLYFTSSLPSTFRSRTRLHLRQRRSSVARTVTMASVNANGNIDQQDLASFHQHLKESSRVLALCGAGLSASSGLPTFRGAGGLWRTHDSISLATPEAFSADPGLVWQ